MAATAWDGPVEFDFVDLFAGLGGFHVALKGLGGRAVFAAEWIPGLQDLYEANHGIRPVGDINEVAPEDVPDHQVLTAGFPCQPFSKAGEQLGFEHTEQGQLFFSVQKILEAKRPRYFILENVPNLLRHKEGKTIERIVVELEALGYEVDKARFSPHDFGIPQIRDRVYIVGALKEHGGLRSFRWPRPEREPTSILDVLDRDPVDTRALSRDVERCLDTWDQFLRLSPEEVKLPSFPIWTMEFGATYPYEDETPYALSEELGSRGLAEFQGSFGANLFGLTVDEQMAALPSHARRPQYKFPKWKVDFIRQNRKFYEDNKAWIDPWLPKIQEFPSSLQKFEWNAKGESRSIWNFVIQLRASGVRVKRPTTAPSLVAMTDTQVPIIGWERRYMSPRECSRLQSLGHIDLPPRRSDAYKALGNAVNATVVTRIVENLIESPIALDLAS